MIVSILPDLNRNSPIFADYISVRERAGATNEHPSVIAVAMLAVLQTLVPEITAHLDSSGLGIVVPAIGGITFMDPHLWVSTVDGVPMIHGHSYETALTRLTQYAAYHSV